MFAKSVQYLREAKEEFLKVTWPTRKDTINYSITVVVISLILAGFIALIDYGFNLGLEGIISTVPAADVTSPDVQVNTEPISATDVQVTTEPAN